MRFEVQQPVSTARVEIYAKNRTAAFARLGAFISTVIVCIRGDSSDSVVEHRQKLFHETLKPYAADAHKHIIGKVGRFGSRWVL